MPPTKGRNKNLVKNLLSKKTDSKGVQTETQTDSKCVQTEQSDNRLTKGIIIEFIKSASLSEKCELLERLILSETPDLKVSCDQSTLLPTSSIVDISKTRPDDWLLNVHNLLKSMGDALSKVILCS
jgi:hypothetical protein